MRKKFKEFTVDNQRVIRVIRTPDSVRYLLIRTINNEEIIEKDLSSMEEVKSSLSIEIKDEERVVIEEQPKQTEEVKIPKKRGRKKMELPMMEDLEIQGQEKIEDTKEFAVKFGFLGVGQGGGKLCQSFYGLGYRRILAVNTTAQDFEGLEFKSKLLIGEGISGAGKDPTVGFKAADSSREKILRACKDAFGDEVEHIMVCTSTGGGSGSGSTPVAIEVAQEYLKSIGKEAKVGVIACLPKASEGQKCVDNSNQLLQKVKPLVEQKIISPFIICDNEKILKMYPKVSIAKFYEAANRSISAMFSLFNELCAKNSAYQTLDVADYRSVLNSGVMIFGANTIQDASKSETLIAESVEKNMKNGLLASLELKGATHAGAILIASKAMLESIPQSALDLSFQAINRVLGGSVVLHSGVYEGPESLESKALVYTMIGGLKAG